MDTTKNEMDSATPASASEIAGLTDDEVAGRLRRFVERMASAERSLLPLSFGAGRFTVKVCQTPDFDPENFTTHIFFGGIRWAVSDSEKMRALFDGIRAAVRS